MTTKVKQTTWKPTRKWIAARVTAFTAIATMWVVTGGWDAEETLATITVVSEAAISYLVSNGDTPDSNQVYG